MTKPRINRRLSPPTGAKRAAWELIAGPVNWDDFSVLRPLKANDPQMFVQMTMALAPRG